MADLLHGEEEHVWADSNYRAHKPRGPSGEPSMAEPIWPTYIGAVTGVVGSITGIAGLVTLA